MRTTRWWIDRLRESRSLPSEGYLSILNSTDSEVRGYLSAQAREVAHSNFGHKVYVRGLVEITNRCRNNCLYCGIRLSNSELRRYSLTHAQILESCREGYRLGFRTFVLQGGEEPSRSDSSIVELVERIRAEFEDVAITLSLGEMEPKLYQRLFDAGANRYLLRHESHNAEHYRKLHPRAMSLERRLRCLDELKQIGYQVGTGIMVGSPHQTTEHITEDIKYIEQFKPEMIGIGPFIPHHATPFAHEAAGSIEQTLKLISIFRLIHPRALIPSTTALATLSCDGRERGILAGANVAMPNISPPEGRGDYSLYDNKASYGSESGEGLRILSDRLEAIGYEISFERGDFAPNIIG
ncbi:MAG: [FeFe] hydrogenase H-cluster radical SAM maturase HydE [Rikenellaceae bacterium]